MTKRSTAAARRKNYVVDVLTQLRTAWANPTATALGAVVGGAVPWFARTVAHHEVAQRWWADPKALIVVGCMLFSVSTVHTFGRACFRSERKALGFVVAVEGVAILCSTPQVWVTALAMLVLINAVTSGCTIALAHADTSRRRAAAAGRRTTRAGAGAAAASTTQVGAGAPSAAPRARRPAAVPATAAAPARARRDHADVADAEVVSWTPAPRARRAPVRLSVEN